MFDMKSWREKGRECGRIRDFVGVEDILIAFFPHYGKDVYSASCH